VRPWVQTPVLPKGKKKGIVVLPGKPSNYYPTVKMCVCEKRKILSYLLSELL
jgi:hypothetical protein